MLAGMQRCNLGVDATVSMMNAVECAVAKYERSRSSADQLVKQASSYRLRSTQSAAAPTLQQRVPAQAPVLTVRSEPGQGCSHSALSAGRTSRELQRCNRVGRTTHVMRKPCSCMHGSHVVPSMW
jgi:hypothetical protein